MGEEEEEKSPLEELKESWENDKRRFFIVLFYWLAIGIFIIVFFAVEINKVSIYPVEQSQSDKKNPLTYKNSLDLFTKYEKGEIDNLGCACSNTNGTTGVNISYKKIAENFDLVPYQICNASAIDIVQLEKNCLKNEECKEYFGYYFMKLLSPLCEFTGAYKKSNMRKFFKNSITDANMLSWTELKRQVGDDYDTAYSDTYYGVIAPYKMINTIASIDNNWNSWFMELHDNGTIGEYSDYWNLGGCQCQWDYDCEYKETDYNSGAKFKQKCTLTQTLLSFSGGDAMKYIYQALNDTGAMNTTYFKSYSASGVESFPWRTLFGYVYVPADYEAEDDFEEDTVAAGSFSEKEFTMIDILNKGMITEQVNYALNDTEDLWKKYFEQCNPPVCKWTEKRKGEPYEVFTVVLGIYGGFSAVLGGIYAFGLKQYDKKFGKKEGNKVSEVTTAPKTL